MSPRAIELCTTTVSSTLFLFIFLILPTSSVAQLASEQPHPAVLQGLKGLQESSRSSPEVAWYQDGQRVRTPRGNPSGPVPGTTAEAATKFVRDNASVFRLEPSTSDVSVEDVREAGLAGKIVRFKQHYRGLPVFDGGLEVYVKPDNTVHLVHNYYVPDLSLDTRPALSAAQAIKMAEDDLSRNCFQYRSKIRQPESCAGQRLELARAPSAQLGVFKSHLAYRLTLDVDRPRLLTEYTIDANDGRILKSRDLIQRITGGGTVFDPSPVSAFHSDSKAERLHAVSPLWTP